MLHGLLVVKRSKERIWSNLPQAARERLLNYRGYDGRDRWPDLEKWAAATGETLSLDKELASVNQSELVMRYVQTNVQSQYLDVLLLTDAAPSLPPKGYRRLGYDFGVLYEYGDPVFFSVLLNEIRPGGNRHLAPLQSALNEHYLLPDHQSCLEVAALREFAFAANSSNFLETAYLPDQCVAVQIFAPDSLNAAGSGL